MKFKTWMVAFILLLIALLISSGCTNTSEVNPVSPVSIPPSMLQTPTITPGVIVTGTAVASNPVPEETQVQVEAYTKRPFGFVQYEYNAAHKVRLLDTYVETDQAGARMIAGTIKNIGTERIDLVVVTVSLLDADGNIIGSTSSEVYYLEPNRVWKFRTTPFTMSDFRTHQVAEIFTG